MSDKLYLKQLEVGPMQNFVYLVGDRDAKEALVVDCAWEADTIMKAAEADGMRLTGALVSHTHFDHINGLDDFLKTTDAPVYVHKHEAGFLKGMKSNLKKVDGGGAIKAGDVSITLIHTPGHTPGSQCFLVEGHLISGDTLFINACGRCDLPGGSAAAMHESLNRLGKLDAKTVLHPGHHYGETPTSTIGDELANNPYMKFGKLDDFLKFRMGW
jgi:hydroxyacylglutathione hydrolase